MKFVEEWLKDSLLELTKTNLLDDLNRKLEQYLTSLHVEDV